MSRNIRSECSDEVYIRPLPEVAFRYKLNNFISIHIFLAYYFVSPVCNRKVAIGYTFFYNVRIQHLVANLNLNADFLFSERDVICLLNVSQTPIENL